MGRKKAAQPPTAAEEVPEVPTEVIWDETNDPFGLRRQTATAEAVQEAAVDSEEQMAVAAEEADGVEEPISAAAANVSTQHRTQTDSQETQKGLKKAHRKGRNDGMTLSEMDKDKVMKMAKKHWAKPPSAVQEKAAEEPAAKPAKKGKKSPVAKGKGKAAKANEEEENQAANSADDDEEEEVVTGFRPELVEKLYAEELGGGEKPAVLARVVVLELSQYLENYLWPYFDATTATKAHLMSILALVNEKFREGVPAWACFHATHSEAFPALMKRILELKKQAEFSLHEKTTYLLFFIHCFQSLEDTMVRAVMLPLVSLPLWRNLSEGRLQLELRATPALEKHWKNLAKKDAKAAKLPDYTPPDARPETWFVPAMFAEFLDIMQAAVVTEEAAEGEPVATGYVTTADAAAVLYCERFLELLGDLLSQLPTRRFVRTLMEDSALLVKCRLSALHGHPRGRLFSQLTDLVRFYQAFQINDHTGAHLSDEDVSLAHAERITQLQRLVFKHVPKLMELALSTVSSLEKRTTLQRYLEMLTAEDTFLLCCEQLRLLSPEDPWAMRLDCLREVLITTFEKPQSQRQAINELPLYPTERILWDENMVPSVNYTGQSVLALPKLNLQFLTFHDYLLRNFNLFRLEATYEIREDIRDVVKRLKPVLVEREEDDVVAFSGWARMALPTANFAVTEVAKPKVGEVKPARVHADLTVDLSRLGGEARFEWDQLRQHDVLFLLCMTPPQLLDHPVEAVEEQAGLRYVRGCEVVELRDEKGTLMNDFTGRVRHDQQRPPEGNLRTLTVALDTAQYQLDVDSVVHNGAEDVYKTMNVVMRRKPKENNFKAILECIRDLMNDDCVMPDWLHDIFLGYGDPGAAHYSKMPNQLRTVTFKDTFVDKQHLLDSFPNNKVEFVGEHAADPKPPFKVTFPAAAAAAEPVKKRKKGGEAEAAETAAAEKVDDVIRVEPYIPPDPGPFPQDQPRTNAVRFTSTQVEAIRAGVNPGLTMVVGPPGTGKTDVAVQILSELYHNFPGQRTLVITHSNHALNDLFVKIMERDIAARHLLRLGMGEQELDTDIDFSRAGRVNSMLARRLQLLAEVEKLARTLEITDDIAYTCETAAHFWLLHVYSRWEEYLGKVDAKRKVSEADAAAAVGALFPFTKYFASAPQPIFHGASFQADMRAANGCMRHLKIIFQELDECRGFEIMKNQGDRSKLLLTKQARIVAMTCTHAAMKRHEFLQLGLQYDNLLMEESAQILEIETFIPMLLQKQEGGQSRLKRVVLIGDHHQLPPVVKNMAFQKYSHMDQSLFTRFVRLGTPNVQLNRQGRARASLAKLYNWRYDNLQNLPRVQQLESFNHANAGFAHEYQFIDVPDWDGVGESEPTPYFYQNLGEAEYVVTVFQYMRMLGYPAKKISIITSYRGQKCLIRDIVNARCANNPLFGKPAKITTVDKFQGQQNDYILLSLCRTRAVGHIRDVRRLVVATSRSRLGLYVFGRRQLFENCYELAPTFKQLLARPDKLAIVPMESHPCSRGVDDKVKPYLVEGLPTMNVVVNQLVAKWQATQSQALRAELPGAEQEEQGEDAMETDQAEEAKAGEVMEEEVVEPQKVEASPKTGGKGKKKGGSKVAAEPEPEPEAMETDAAEAQVENSPKTGGKGKKGGRGRGTK